MKGHITLYKKAGCKFIIPKREQFIVNEIYEQIKDFNKKIHLVADIGAHVGAFSVIFAKRNLSDDGKIWAFEPDIDNYYLLLTNIFLNKLERKIIPLKLGVSDKVGWEYLYKPKPPLKRNTGQRSTVYKKDFPIVGEIPVIDLKTMFALMKYPPDYLKCDVEGAEFKIFSKLTDMDKIRYLNIEVHTDKKYFDKPDSQLSLIKKLNNAGFNIKGKPKTHRYFILASRSTVDN